MANKDIRYTTAANPRDVYGTQENYAEPANAKESGKLTQEYVDREILKLVFTEKTLWEPAVSTASGLPPVGPASENGGHVLLARTPRGPHAPSTSSRPVHAAYALPADGEDGHVSALSRRGSAEW